MASRRRAAEGTRSAAARTPVLRRVRKRDGREVPFDAAKIQAAVARALEAVGEPDPGFAGEVAELVELTLRENAGRATPRGRAAGETVPGIEEIQDLVERALMELGRTRAAKAYILYRDRRARVRAAVQVSKPGGRGRLRVREVDGVSAWSKGRIVAALMDEAELPRAAAEEVAASVEKRVFAAGLRRITTELVRELVAAELCERGLSDALGRQAPVGLARHDLARLLRGEALRPWEPALAPGGVAEGIAGELLQRFVLDGVLPDDVAELHRAGDLTVVDPSGLGRAQVLSLDAELVASGGDAGEAAQALLEGAARLARDVGRALVLERPAAILARLVRSTKPGSPFGLSAFLRSLGAVAGAAGVRIELGASGARFTSFHAQLVRELAELTGVPSAPGLFLGTDELAELLRAEPDAAPAVERLLAAGRLAVTWGDGEETFVAPGCSRRARERGAIACLGAVALHLPRLARRAGPWSEEIMLSGLAELVQAALAAARALLAFPARGGAAGLLARPSFAIVPVGLREALRILGDGEVDPELGGRLLGFLGEAARRFAPSELAVVAPSPFYGEEAAARAAWLDRAAREREGRRQPALFADVAAAEPPPVPGADLGLSPVPGYLPGGAEGEAQRTLAAGAFRSPRVSEALDRADLTPRISAWRRFERERERRRAARSLQLFPLGAAAPSAGPGALGVAGAGRRDEADPAPLSPLL